MTAALFVAALAVLGAYVCRLDSLDKTRDPVWYMLATYAGFVLTVDSAAALADHFDTWPLVGLVVSSAWLVGTYIRPIRA